MNCLFKKTDCLFEKIKENENIEIIKEEVTKIPEGITIIATGFQLF